MNEVGPAQSWRMIHDGVKVIQLFESAGVTSSMNTIFEAATRDLCIAEAVRLSLILPLDEPVGTSTIMSSLEFISRFSEETQLRVAKESMRDPVVKLWYDKMLAADYIDTNYPLFRSGLLEMVKKGLLTEEEARAVLE